jgi:hypothetical protein
MTIRIEIKCDNEAFDDEGFEVARILQGLSEKIRRRGVDYYPIMDLNGNKVGECNVDDLND